MTTMSTSNRHEILIGLHVSDDAGYQRYRDGMTPLLEACGGTFRYDFRVGEMLRGKAEKPINRLFLISFPDVDTKTRFFSDPAYLAVRGEHFDKAVDVVERIAEFAQQVD
ncbi:MAG: hypothetical protein ACI8QZ_000913 [Chlamydiales bacterium]|jgi:uncharacterized protein (DUF1330 family)